MVQEQRILGVKYKCLKSLNIFKYGNGVLVLNSSVLHRNFNFDFRFQIVINKKKKRKQRNI